MAKFDAKLALKGAPVKLRNGLKAYVDTCDLEGVFAYGGYTEGREARITWTKERTEFCNLMSPLDIVSMWEDKESETSPEVEENIFEKALKEKLPLRYTVLEDNINDFYCIAKTSDGDYILERNDTCAVYVTKLSLFARSLKWYIATPKLPKAFKPNEGEEFWFIHPTDDKKVRNATFDIGNVFYNGLANAGLAFCTREEATQALHFLRSNIEVDNGEEQK